MISKTRLRELVNDIEVEYVWCWEFLSNLKRSKQIKPEMQDFMKFQPRLATALFRLDSAYQTIGMEKKLLIKRKLNLSPKWFANRMRILSDYRSSLVNVIGIGKVIGDSFAWLFYGGHRDILRKHFRHERIDHLPMGIGGKGELEFVKQYQIINGCLVIYHGITSFLRIGDISLFDPNSMKLVAIGELKTTKIDDTKLLVRLCIVGDLVNNIKKEEIIINSNYSFEQQLPQNIKNKLEKQLKKMTDSLVFAKSEMSLTFDSNSYLIRIIELLKQLENKFLVSEKIDDGLLMFIFKNSQKSLFSRFFNMSKNNIKKRLKNFENKVETIANTRFIKNGINRNSLIINGFKPDTFIGRTPLFWWSVSPKITKEIVFQNTQIVTIYNPAFLLEKLENVGFEIKENNRKISAKIIVGSKFLKIQNVKYFLGLIQTSLYEENLILSVFESLLEKIKTNEIKSNTNVELDIQQFFE